jgi:transketolase
MRAIPSMTVVVPSDAVAVDQALRACAAHPGTGPIYLRLGRGPEALFSDPAGPFSIGQARQLREGADLTLVANGSMVFEALLASDALREIGVDASVLDVHTVKPIDRDALLREAARTRAMLVVEEHSVLGGLGGAVAEWMADQGGVRARLLRFGTPDRYLHEAGDQEYARQVFGLTAEAIATRLLVECARRRGEA